MENNFEKGFIILGLLLSRLRLPFDVLGVWMERMKDQESMTVEDIDELKELGAALRGEADRIDEAVELLRGEDG